MKYPGSLFLIAFILYGCGTKPVATIAPPPSLPVLTLRADTITTYQTYPAAIQGEDDIEIRPQVSGTLEEVFVDEGAFVKAGDPLFRINEQPFRAALNNATASLHAAEGTYANADLEVQKLTPLVQNKVLSDYQLKTAKVAADVAKANIEQAKANITAAQINLGYCLIKAPVSGYVGRLLRKKGSLVGPGDPIALTDLSDVHNVHVYFSLSENDFNVFKETYPGSSLNEKLKQLPPVTLLLSDNTTYPVKGKVDIVDGQFDKTTAAITLRAVFPNTDGILRAGNTGKIQLGLQHQDMISVPQAATIELQDKIFVYALGDSNIVKKVQIKVVGHSDQNYLLGGGLKAGDRIVTDGILTLQDGAVIAPASAKN
ncbi:membrane fusion protein, multidrug efflux system [Chitinophaga sp. YR627]|uniref:efflux RND transporter periplasmic adaptor subunit n=1 Tax=Chitinophaga sp. YR627 TaxID=1881041 RepID=UPI0008F0B0EE|nr:efflux RND transporter periplasmic adaptor subunit [Chitinophaga sp. YR627]SFN21390.1 membrane fusion protein, multidrug efflux system [Chitinophaga sp. YR627]